MSIFGEKEQQDVGLFGGVEQPEVELEAEPSTSVLAGQASLLYNEQDPVTEYTQLKSLAPETRDKEMQNKFSQVKDSDMEGTYQEALNMLSTPTLPEEQRLGAGKVLMEGTQPKDSTQLLLEQGISQPAYRETPEQEEIRLNLAEFSKEISDRIRLEQQILNGELLNTSPDALNTLGDAFEYFIPFSEQKFTQEVVGKIRNGDKDSITNAFLLLGESKNDMAEKFMSMGFQEQTEFLKNFATILESSSGVVFTNDNDLMKKDLLLTMIREDHYGTGFRTLDNVTSVLELALGFAPPIAKLAGATRVAAAASRVARAGRRSTVQPSSAAATYKQTNPSRASDLTEAAIADETGQVALATHGTSREDVVIDAHAPQVRNEGGSINMLPFEVRSSIDRVMQDHLFEFSPAEIAQAQKAMQEEFTDLGVVKRHNQSPAPTTNPDGSVTFSNIYSQEGGTGWKFAQEALESVQRAFRAYDVPEDAFKLLQRQGTSYELVDISEVQAKAALRDELVKRKKKLPDELKKVNMVDDYIVQVDFTRTFDPKKVEAEQLSYSMNFLDRIKGFTAKRQGGVGITRMLADPGSIFDFRITGSAAVAVDRSAKIEADLLRLVDSSFAEPFKKLSKDRQDVLHDVIREQNKLEHNFDKVELKARGVVDPEELKILEGWRDIWDTMYFLENRDYVKSQKASGYSVFEDTSSRTKLIAKPIPKPSQPTSVYDAELDQVRVLDKAQIDELYESGGAIAQTKRTETVPNTEETFDFVLSKNTINNRIREISDNDLLLDYKSGYYHVRYKDPYFIMKTVARSDGTKTTSAVQTVGSIKEANLVRDRLAAKNTDENVSYGFVENKDLDLDEVEHDLNVVRGRSAQRIRGERVGSENKDGFSDEGEIFGPTDSLLLSARSLSRRISLKDNIDKQKVRLMSEFKDLMPPDDFGQPRYPKNISEIGGEGVSSFDKRVADARTYYEYINSLEFGYRSALDDVWKYALNGMAQAVGLFSARGEKFLRATAQELASPTGFIRGRAFDAYLATNPFRQFVVQGHQASLLLANFPEYVASQQLAREMIAIHLAMFSDKALDAKVVRKLTGMSPEEAKALAKEYTDTGLDAAIDKNNLIEGSIDQLLTDKRFKTGKEAYGAVVGRLRKIGFDAGERLNIMSSWLAHRNKYLKQDADLSNPRVKAAIHAEARNYTLNMNAAGEMPYNKNSLSLLFQFMQVPHKMMLTMLTNKQLTAKEKARLGAYNMIMLPLPVGLVYGLLGSELIEENEVAKEIIVNGVEGMLLNKLAQATFGDDTSVSFSSFTTADVGGMYDLLESFITADLTEIVSNAPSMSLLMGHNPRVGNFLEATARVFSEPSGENFFIAAEQFAKISSGYANLSTGFKEVFLDEYTVRYNRSGKASDENITTPESLAKILGLGTTREMVNYQTRKLAYQKSQEAMEDVKKIYQEASRAIVRAGIMKDDPDYYSKALNEVERISSFWAVATPRMRQEMLKLIRLDMQRGDVQDNIYKIIRRASQLMTVEEAATMLRNNGQDPSKFLSITKDFEGE